MRGADELRHVVDMSHDARPVGDGLREQPDSVDADDTAGRGADAYELVRDVAGMVRGDFADWNARRSRAVGRFEHLTRGR